MSALLLDLAVYETLGNVRHWLVAATQTELEPIDVVDDAHSRRVRQTDRPGVDVRT
jgi:hypothetical protein